MSDPIASCPPIPIAPFRVGSVPYLNAAPLTLGIEQSVQFVVPARLAEMLRANQLDAALVSLAEVLFNDRYEVLDSIAIASAGAVYSVILAHRPPLPEIKEIALDIASLSGANLLRVLLGERGLNPDFVPLPDYRSAIDCDAVLLIGDRAIDFQLAPHPHTILDLGQAWHELTGLPFVYAVWALRQGIDHAPLRKALVQARDRGLRGLPGIIRNHPDYTAEFRERYFGQHVRYELGPREKAGVRRFVDLLRRHGLGPIFEPRYIR